MLTETQKAHLAEGVYPRALAETGLTDTAKRQSIAASDYLQFLALGAGTDDEAVAAVAAGLRADADAGQDD